MTDAVYGQHLSYRTYNPSHNDTTIFFNWTMQYEIYENETRSLSRVSYCRSYYINENPKYALPETEIEPNFSKTFVTLGVMLASVIFGHLTLWLSTRFIKHNNRQVLSYNSEIEEMERLLAKCDRPKDLHEAKELLDEKIKEVR